MFSHVWSFPFPTGPTALSMIECSNLLLAFCDDAQWKLNLITPGQTVKHQRIERCGIGHITLSRWPAQRVDSFDKLTHMLEHTVWGATG